MGFWCRCFFQKKNWTTTFTQLWCFWCSCSYFTFSFSSAISYTTSPWPPSCCKRPKSPRKRKRPSSLVVNLGDLDRLRNIDAAKGCQNYLSPRNTFSSALTMAGNHPHHLEKKKKTSRLVTVASVWKNINNVLSNLNDSVAKKRNESVILLGPVLDQRFE